MPNRERISSPRSRSGTPMLLQAFHYKQWSDQRTVEAVRRIDDAQFPAAAAFARQQFNHMVIVEELFRARLSGAPAPHTATNTPAVPHLDELERRLSASDHWFLDYAAAITPAQMAQSIAFEFTDGKRGSMTLEEILFHIVNHGSYHRGSIAHALDLANVPHPADTYTVYIHTAEPARRQAA